MTIEVRMKVCENIFIAEIFGGINDRDNAQLWMDIFSDAQDHQAEGILLINHLNSSISPTSALTLNSNASKFPDIKVIANCRMNLPESNNMFVYTLMQRVAKSSDREFRNFFNKDEAIQWLKLSLKEAKKQEKN